MLKKITDFFCSPVFHVIFGFVFLLWLGAMILYLGIDLCPMSAFLGALLFIANYIFTYGLISIFGRRKGEKNTRQDLDE